MATLLVTDDGFKSHEVKQNESDVHPIAQKANAKVKYEHEWFDENKQDEDGSVKKTSQLIEGIYEGMMFASLMKDEDMKQDTTVNRNDFKEEKEAKDDKFNLVQCCVLVIGLTGSGKSRICGLLTGHDIATSDGADSVQKESKLYTSKYNQNIQFIDTMGTQDSDQQYNDPQILKKALRYLNTNQINKLKVIWCVSGDTETRKNRLFMDEAKFINNLKIPLDEEEMRGRKAENSTSVWDSVLIVKKQGTSTDGLTGPKEAANTFDANYEASDTTNTFGFKCIEWTDKTKDVILSLIPVDKYEQCGYFNLDKARKIIENKLNKLPLFELKFRKQICRKCGSKGDCRYVDALCHTSKELMHDGPILLRHPGKLVYYHPQEPGDAVPVVTGHTHTKPLTSLHTKKCVGYHPGPSREIVVKRAVCTAYNSYIKPIKKVLGNIQYGWGWDATKYESVDWTYWDCCNQYVYIEYDKACPPCKSKWECCKTDKSNKECALEDAPKIWSCCNAKENEIGCKEISEDMELYECCGMSEDSVGCTQKYDCCDSIGEGCEKYYSCCDKLLGEDGCQWKCANCKLYWGIGPNFGCVEVKN